MCAKVIVIGGPRSGKSTFALSQGIPVFCSDPLSLVKEPVQGVTYLPESFDWSQGSDYICDKWFTQAGPAIFEGVGMVRALRKWAMKHTGNPADKIVYFQNNHPTVERSIGQDAMAKAIDTIWNGIAYKYSDITEYRQW